MMDNFPGTLLGANLYTITSTTSNLVNYGTILYVPPDTRVVEREIWWTVVFLHLHMGWEIGLCIRNLWPLIRVVTVECKSLWLSMPSDLKLPEGTTDYIKQYMHSNFNHSYENWISLWVPLQGFKPGPANLKHSYHPPRNFVNFLSGKDPPWLEEPLVDEMLHKLMDGDFHISRKPSQNGEWVTSTYMGQSGTNSTEPLKVTDLKMVLYFL
ncbi:hypothetical protein CPB84DRAFT_1746487 [Gymnopilus junonius]|uniref:Uncharacterized protein n=1 Tax=Gymnopilus junonius TaxID=109634 RepID=A0A9P5NQ70_GYMJU|nr:hypothetical protein CPB84DRAFT_1746487 [Gymnopilus junonius]